MSITKPQSSALIPQEKAAQQPAGLVLDTLPILALDHPGASDPEYRKRRDEIARAALEFHLGDPSTRQIPAIRYTKEEQRVWRHVNERLEPLHEQWACSLYKEGRRRISIPEDHIPQLADLSTRLGEINGYRLEPIHGLVDPRAFLSRLADKVMLSTQYMRHHSCPEFTPEPDIIHEVLGHVPTFTDGAMVNFQFMIGKAAQTATEEEFKSLSRLYWFTVEYGLIEEGDKIRAFGAGLLGGIQDLTNAMTEKVPLQKFTMDEVINTPYEYSFGQPRFFVFPSLEFLHRETKKLIAGFRANREHYDDFGAPLETLNGRYKK